VAFGSNCGRRIADKRNRAACTGLQLEGDGLCVSEGAAEQQSRQRRSTAVRQGGSRKTDFTSRQRLGWRCERRGNAEVCILIRYTDSEYVTATGRPWQGKASRGSTAIPLKTSRLWHVSPCIWRFAI